MAAADSGLAASEAELDLARVAALAAIGIALHSESLAFDRIIGIVVDGARYVIVTPAKRILKVIEETRGLVIADGARRLEIAGEIRGLTVEAESRTVEVDWVSRIVVIALTTRAMVVEAESRTYTILEVMRTLTVKASRTWSVKADRRSIATEESRVVEADRY